MMEKSTSNCDRIPATSEGRLVWMIMVDETAPYSKTRVLSKAGKSLWKELFITKMNR
jgi:hypothetical protein